MEHRYITMAQADRMRAQALVTFRPPTASLLGDVFRDGQACEYYIVRDDDPRLTAKPTPDPRLAHDGPSSSDAHPEDVMK